MDHPLRPIAQGWLEKIGLALDHKRSQFSNDAEEAMRFFGGNHDFMYEREHASRSKGLSIDVGNDADFPTPTFRMTLNRVAEMVQLFGPALYHRNPNRLVSPRRPVEIPAEAIGDPMQPMVQHAWGLMAQQQKMRHVGDDLRARLIQKYINWTPNELDLKTHSRKAIDETIIKGMGCLWTELKKRPNSDQYMVGSFYDTVDNLLIDPDMESIEDALWIAKRVVEPIWQVEEDYGIPHGEISGNLESQSHIAQTLSSEDRASSKARGKTNDLLRHWLVWTKMGMGERMQGGDVRLQGQLDEFGQYCYLCVAEGIPYPLNLNPWRLAEWDDEQLVLAAQWPIPFWADDRWPFTPIIFHEVPRQVWPMSHLQPGLGELRFLNWAFSFLMGKIRTASRDFIAVAKDAGEELKRALLSGADYELIELSQQHRKTINEAVQFLQHPGFHGDVYRVIEAVMQNFEKRVGLTELAYAVSSRQMRSATEASVKADQIQIRPDDMANRVEEAMTEVARKEALCCRWFLTQEDVAPVLGPEAGSAWQTYVYTTDVEQSVHELEYRVEAGSARKPNRDTRIAQLTELGQVMMPTLQAFALQGWTGPWNAFIDDLGKAMDTDTGKYLLNLPPPPPEGQEDPEHDQEMRQDEEKHQQDMRHTEESEQLKLDFMRDQNRIKLMAAPRGNGSS